MICMLQSNLNCITVSTLKKIIGHFTVVYLVAKPLIWSEAEGDLVVIRDQYLVSMISIYICI